MCLYGHPPPQFLYSSSIGRHLGDFHTLAIVSNAANMDDCFSGHSGPIPLPSAHLGWLTSFSIL